MKKIWFASLMLLLLIGIVAAVPSLPHSFRGTAKYSDGKPIPNGYLVTAKLGDQEISTSSIIKDGKYGYDDPLLVSDTEGTGGKIYFYINGKLVENAPVDFEEGKTTILNLVVKAPPTITIKKTSGGGSNSRDDDCAENWTCTNWSNMEKSCGVRKCTDSNECDTDKYKPLEEKDCPTDR